MSSETTPPPNALRVEELPLTVVDSSRLTRIDWAELWAYRELFGFLVWRDFLVRYKQTAVGIFWAILRPVLMLVVVVVVFGYVLGRDQTSDLPFPIIALAGIVPWEFFSQALTFSSQSLINNHPLVAKTYLPRMLLPASAVTVHFIDIAISMGVLLLMMPLFGVSYQWTILAVVPLTVVAALLAFGTGLFVSALNVKYRDFKYVLPFFIQLGFYATPVGFTSDDVPEKLQWLFYLNPMAGVVEGFRWAVFGEGSIAVPSFAIAIGATILITFFGMRFFRRSESWFADVI